MSARHISTIPKTPVCKTPVKPILGDRNRLESGPQVSSFLRVPAVMHNIDKLETKQVIHICIYVYIYIYICIYIYIHIHTHIHICMCSVYIHVYIYIYMYIHMCVYIYTHLYMDRLSSRPLFVVFRRSASWRTSAKAPALRRLRAPTSAGFTYSMDMHIHIYIYIYMYKQTHIHI